MSTQGPAPSTGEFQARPVAPAASTSPDDVGRQRVAEFIYAALQECQIGSDPVTVAERMIDDIGLLPADFRRELEVGESSLLACLPTYIGPEAAQALEQDVGQRPHMLEWFAAFVAALRGDSELAGHSGSGGGVAAAESTPGVNGSHTGGSAPFRSGLMPPSATDAARELELPDPE